MSIFQRIGYSRWAHVAAVCLSMVLSASVVAEDRWQWLETPYDEEALAWASERSAEAQAKLAAEPSYVAVLDRLKALMASGDLSPQISTLDADRLIRFQRSAERPDGVLSIAQWQLDGQLGPWQPVFDVATFNQNQGNHHELRWRGAGAHCLPPAMNRCLLHLSPGGSDEEVVKEFDLISGEFVAGGFQVPASRTWAVWLGEDQLLIQHTVGEAPARTVTGWPAEVKLWRRGQVLAEAETVFAAQASDALIFLAGRGDSEQRGAVIVRAIDYSHFEFWHFTIEGGLNRIDLPPTVKLMFPTPVSARHVFVQLSSATVIDGREWPAETILAYDLSPTGEASSPLSVVYEPQPGEYLINALTGGLVANDQKLWLAFDRRGTQQVAVAHWRSDEWLLERWAPEAPGVTVTFADAHHLSAAVVVQRSGLLQPAELSWMANARGAPRRVFAERPLFDHTRFDVSLHTAVSADGTEIDYFLLSPIGPEVNRPVPLLMTGYGAFGLSYSPAYLDSFVGGRSLVPWLEQGGALVVPLIRGGGERGAAWHVAAMREHRQRSYDDFAAVAEDLLAQGVTTRQKLGVFGMSNGGLLAAVMGTQRPDLFAAVVSDVPLTDMLRYPEMGMGAAWINEYGDPNVVEMAAVLRSYSPFHNVSPERDYPAFLITVATSDNRVGPGHARKLAARLAEAGGEVYFIEERQGGHGVSDPLSRPELMAQRIVFLLSRLNPADTP